MLEKLLKELEKLEKTQLSVPVNTDKEGYFDRECPAEECQFQFKIHEEDWNEKIINKMVFCPMCRHTANSDNWWPKEHLANAKNQAVKYIKSLTKKALQEGVKDFNSKQSKNSFIKVRASVSGSSPYYILPIPAEEEIERKIVCSQCHTKYAVLGSAYFCPCCGHNSVEDTFDNSIASIRSSIKNIPAIKKAVAEISKDEAINACRSLIEKSLLDCVVAFQRFCEVTYRKQARPDSNIPFNAFQKLDVGGNLWLKILGESYRDWLTTYEYQRLNVLFQRRHLLQHTEGIVDKKYLEKTNDTSYQEGQRIVTKEKDVLELADYIERLVLKLKSYI